MGKKVPRQRDGTGPAEESYQNKNASQGKRQQAGEPCPKKKKDVVSVSGAKKTISSYAKRRRNTIRELFEK